MSSAYETARDLFVHIVWRAWEPSRAMRTSAAVVLITVALAAGCGGGGNAAKPNGEASTPPSQGSSSMSRSAYIARADAVCGTLTPRLASIPRLSAATVRDLKMGRITHSGFADLAALSGGILHATRGALVRVSRLPTPANDGLVRRWRSLVRQTLEDAAALHSAALARDRNDLIQALAADERDSAAYMQLTHRLGFRRCGRTF